MTDLKNNVIIFIYSDTILLYSRFAPYISEVFVLSPKLILYIIATLLMVKSLISFIFKTLSAKSFRKKVALPRGFAEGVMTGSAYPILIITLVLLLIQSVLFFVLPSKAEPMAILRLFLFIITFFAFIYFDRKTPSLRAYWFGKNAMWEKRGENGKIPYTDIYCAKVSPKISLPGSSGQQLCKISFFVKDKKLFFGRKKYVCRMTSYAINELANQVEFNGRSHSHALALPFKKRVLSFVLSVLLTLITVSLILPVFSFGILNNETYSGAEIIYNEPLKTISPITEIAFIDGKLCVYYKNIEAAEFYTPDGSFAYALSFPASGLKSSEFSVKDGTVNYRYGDTILRHSPLTGETNVSKYTIEHNTLFEKTKEPTVSDTGDIYTHDRHSVLRKDYGKEGYGRFLSRSPFIKLFDIEVTWTLTAMLLTLAFVIHFILADKPKNIPAPRPQKTESVSEPPRPEPPTSVPPRFEPPKKNTQVKENKKKEKKSSYDDSLPDDWMI